MVSTPLRPAARSTRAADRDQRRAGLFTPQGGLYRHSASAGFRLCVKRQSVEVTQRFCGFMDRMTAELGIWTELVWGMTAELSCGCE